MACQQASPELAIHIVCDSRVSRSEFLQDTLLGRCPQRPEHRDYNTAICFGNSDPLAITYNSAIEAAPPGSALVFCHDDLDLGPEPLGTQLQAALARFDLEGVAGNQRHQRSQIAWWLDPHSGCWDHPFLSGAIRHGTPERSQLNVFGPAPMPVQLLDGVFLAARADTLQRSGVRFDPRFTFHHYDLDLCRSARRAGLSLGTWPLPLLHASGGEPWGETWQECQQAYLRKWSEGSELDQPGKSTSPELWALLKSARALTNRGALLQLKGDLDAAAAAHGEALRLDPGLTIAGDNLLALALQLRSLGRSHQALEALRVILRATPQRPDLLLQLGTTLMELGRVEAAVPCFRRLLRQEPQLREGHYQLGQALAALGHTEAGIAELDTALALDPAATEVLTNLEWHRLSLCDWDGYDRRAARLLAQLLARHRELPLFNTAAWVGHLREPAGAAPCGGARASRHDECALKCTELWPWSRHSILELPDPLSARLKIRAANEGDTLKQLQRGDVEQELRIMRIRRIPAEQDRQAADPRSPPQPAPPPGPAPHPVRRTDPPEPHRHPDSGWRWSSAAGLSAAVGATGLSRCQAAPGRRAIARSSGFAPAPDRGPAARP
jgi:tetratricopeptide (TPR) repeat protein